MNIAERWARQNTDHIDRKYDHVDMSGTLSVFNFLRNVRQLESPFSQAHQLSAVVSTAVSVSIAVSVSVAVSAFGRCQVRRSTLRSNARTVLTS
jgi:hypothetical protein